MKTKLLILIAFFNSFISFSFNKKSESSFADIVVSTATEIRNAIASANPGDRILVLEGNYTFTTRITISRNGTNGNVISLLSHPNNISRPVFNFSSMAENSSNRAISLSANYWHIKGIEIFGAGDNGLFIGGSNNLIEFCSFSECKDSGLQIGSGGANNVVLNCDSFNNADSTLENADGFACKLDAGTGNKFIGCRAWQNLDDGWDGYLRGADNITTTYENCWAIRNGYLKNGTIGAGDGNGFKTGGSDDKLLKHNAIYKNCIAAGNVFDGYDHNSNRGNIEIYNCSAYSNGRNISFSNSNKANSLTIKNSVSLASASSDSFNATIMDITNNSWQNGLVVNSADFEGLNILELMTSPRQADGSLPDVDFMKLVAGSDLIDAGVDVGLAFNGSAPDLGYFEFGTLSIEDLSIKGSFTNYPNPFSMETNVVFNLTQATKIGISVYNLTGVKVYDIPEKIYESGQNSIILNRNKLASGNYLLVLKGENNKLNSKLITIQ